MILSVIACRLSPVACFAKEPEYVRVAIMQEADSLRLKIKGFYEIMDLTDNKSLSRGKDLDTTVTAYRDRILLPDIKSGTANMLIKSDDAYAIMIDGRLFRGNIRLIKKENSRLLVINQIDLEGYIKGILYHESSHYWPIEALKAQAVVCRTYAIYAMQGARSKDYDVTSDVYSQVYGGQTSERYRTSKAVDATKGYMLTYHGQVFPAYYHATCAGHTEDASLLWDIDIEPLKGVSCGFCKDSPHANWHYVLSIDELIAKLAANGYKIDRIKDILILKRSESGRAIDLKILSDKKEIVILAKDFRNIIGPNIIRSTNFNLKLIVNSDVVFEGLGWGHGVGLCQWGAYFMAKQGRNYAEILKYYYPGTEISIVP